MRAEIEVFPPGHYWTPECGLVPFATPVPLLLERTAGSRGCLVGHLARANPQWEQAGGQTALAVFAGPHAYISPTWYEAEHVVPTWNYVAVHASGPVQIIEDRGDLLETVRETVRVHERALPRPWSLAGSDTFVERLLGQIVGFRVEIAKIEGKWKLSQNHPEERREKVAAALESSASANDRAVARLMREGG